MNSVSKEVRKEVFEECGIIHPKRDRRFNLHHIVFKSDVKRGLVPKHFPVNARENLIPLPIEVHAELHDLVERTPAYKTNIECRIWLANMAYNGELDLLY